MHEAIPFSRENTNKCLPGSDQESLSSVFRRSLFLANAEDSFLRESQSFQQQFSARLQDFIAAGRNIPCGLFVYTGAALYRAAQGEIQKKPRGGSRGVMTRSFSGR